MKKKIVVGAPLIIHNGSIIIIQPFYFFHFCSPVLINICSTILIIKKLATQKIEVYGHQSFVVHRRSQFFKFKHLLVGPVGLVILALPRLTMSFVSGCMKSTRDPWLLLAGHILSYIPPMLSIFIFVLPSEIYRSELSKHLKKIFSR